MVAEFGLSCMVEFEVLCWFGLCLVIVMRMFVVLVSGFCGMHRFLVDLRGRYSKLYISA